MTLNEAFAELGIERDADAAQARRAYLKLLKVRKPETDAAGFMRLREAYEAIKAHHDSSAAFRKMLGIDADPAPPRPVSPGPQPVSEGPQAEDDRPPAGDAPPPAPSLEEAPEEPIDRFPLPPLPPRSAPHRARPWAETGSPSGKQPPIVFDAPVPADLPLAQDPPPPDDPPAPQIPTEASIDSLLAIGLNEQAAEEMTRLFDHAAAHVNDVTPPLQKALRLLLILHVKNALDAAGTLHERVAAWLRASGQEARLLRGEAAVRWGFLRELDALERKFPAAVRGPAARAILAGDLAQARGDVAEYQRKNRPAALELAVSLRKKSPLLAAQLAPVLDPPAPPEPAPRPVAPPSAGGGRWAWGLIVVALGIVRLVAASARSTPDYPSYTPPRLNLPPLADLDAGLPSLHAEVDDLKEKALRRAQSLKSHAEYMLTSGVSSGDVDYAGLTLNVDAVGRAIERDDIAGARVLMKNLKARVRGDAGYGNDETRIQVATFERVMESWCRARELSAAIDAGGGDPGAHGDAGAARDAGAKKRTGGP